MIIFLSQCSEWLVSALIIYHSANQMSPIDIWTHSASLKLNFKKLRSWDPALSFMANGERVEAVTNFFILASKTTEDGASCNQRMFASLQDSYEKHKQCIEKQKHHSAQQTGRCLAFSFGFLNFLSSPHWASECLSFLVLHNSQDCFLHFFTQS